MPVRANAPMRDIETLLHPYTNLAAFRDTGPLGQGATGYCNAPGISWGSAARDAALP